MYVQFIAVRSFHAYMHSPPAYENGKTLRKKAKLRYENPFTMVDQMRSQIYIQVLILQQKQ